MTHGDGRRGHLCDTAAMGDEVIDEPTVVTVACDGGEMDLFVWRPATDDGTSRPALLLIQEIFGVGPYIRAVAGRLVSTGYVVAAPDVFWRVAPGWVADHDAEGLGASMEQVAKLDPAAASADCVAALDRLGSLEGVAGRPGVIGFCLGGTLAWGVAGRGDPSVCVSYYGSGVPAMLGLVDQVTCPTLFQFGSDDAHIPSDGVEALAAAIIGRPGFVLNVERAGHAFDNHESEMFHDAEAARAAWSKTLAFLAEHLPVT